MPHEPPGLGGFDSSGDKHMTYFYTNEKGEREEVERERWMWIAKYVDGTELFQFNDDTGEFHRFQEVDRERCVAIVMRDIHGREIHAVSLDGGQPFHFYRKRRSQLPDGTFTEVRTIYVFGWKHADGSERYHYILPDDTVVCASKDTPMGF